MGIPDRKARVLIVDDDGGMLHAAQRILSGRCEVRTAQVPSRALETAPAFRPDLVICDIRMPETDGFALVAELRARLPDVDAIFMTGSHSEPDAHLIRALQNGAFYFIEKPFDRRVLSTLVDRCLELRHLRQTERAHTRRLEAELDEARIVQRMMLAPAQATFRDFRLEARCLPCNELGGDLYDYTETPDGRLAFILADVRGHGASASLLTALVKSTFHANPEHSPRQIAEALAAAVSPFGDDRYITAFCGLFDPRSRRLEYVSAGHPPPIVRVLNAPTILLQPTAPIACSAFPAGSWEAAHIDLPQSSALFVYTDGLLEVFSRAPVAGTRRVAEILEAAPLDAAAIVAAVLDAVERSLGDRPAGDDISMLALSEV
jgi:phosphoserine phosphatase RsbU/P